MENAKVKSEHRECILCGIDIPDFDIPKIVEKEFEYYKDGKKMVAHKGDLLCGVCYMNVYCGIDVYEGRDWV